MEIEEINQLLTRRNNDLHRIHNGSIWKVDTGFPDLNRSTGGFRENDLIIIAAHPCMGRMTLAYNLAYNIAALDESGKSFLFFSGNLSHDELSNRLISDLSEVDNWKIHRNSLDQTEFSQIDQATKSLTGAALYVDDTTHLTFADLKSRAHDLNRQYELGAIIDDLDILLPYNKTAYDYTSQLDAATHGLKNLARGLKIPIIITTDLPRSDTNDAPRPSLADLKPYGSLEKDASIVIFLHRPDYYASGTTDNPSELDEIPRNITELIIAKNTHGPITTTEIYFHPDKLKFIPIEDPEL